MRDSLTVSCFLQVHNILAEMVMGGMVLETNMNEIIMQVDAQNKMEKSEVSGPRLPAVCTTLFSIRSLRYGTQYAGMCVCCTMHATLQWPCGCSLPTIECLCSFFGLLSCCCCCSAPNTGSQHILPCMLQYKVQYHSHLYCHIMDIY